MLRSVLFSVVALAAAGSALAHDADHWDRDRHERQEWRHERHEREERWDARHYDRPAPRYYAEPRYYAPAREYREYYAPRYYGYPDRDVYVAPAYPSLGLSFVVPLR